MDGWRLGCDIFRCWKPCCEPHDILTWHRVGELQCCPARGYFAFCMFNAGTHCWILKKKYDFFPPMLMWTSSFNRNTTRKVSYKWSTVDVASYKTIQWQLGSVFVIMFRSAEKALEALRARFCYFVCIRINRRIMYISHRHSINNFTEWPRMCCLEISAAKVNAAQLTV